jgi:hypothetical protein
VRVEGIRKLIEEMHLRAPRDFHAMDIEQISRELREAMKFERETLQRIEELEKNGVEQDLADYAKIICRNTTGREISEIQEIYLKKIDNEYLNSN